MVDKVLTILILIGSILITVPFVNAEESTNPNGQIVIIPKIEEALQVALMATSKEEFIKHLDEAEQIARGIKDATDDPRVIEYCDKKLAEISRMRRVGYIETKLTKISSRLFTKPGGVLETVVNNHILLMELKKDIELINNRISSLEAANREEVESERFSTTTMVSIVAVLVALLALLHCIIIQRRAKKTSLTNKLSGCS
jgi:hypothetical protein